MKYTILTFFAMLAFGNIITAQEGKVNSVQPDIIVIPYTKEGQDIRTVLESDINLRIALAKVKEAFDNRGFTTIDFVATLKALSADGGMTQGTKTSIKRQIIERSKADIYVEVEVFPMPSGFGNSVRIILTAYDAYTGNSLSNKTGTSAKRYTDDYGTLIELAMTEAYYNQEVNMLEDFLNVMQTKFDDIVKNGRSIKVFFSFTENSDIDMHTLIGPKRMALEDVLEEWMADNSFKNYYQIGGQDETFMNFEEVKIPLKDESKRNYTTTRFASSLNTFCNGLYLAGKPQSFISAKRDVRGSVIYITFN